MAGFALAFLKNWKLIAVVSAALVLVTATVVIVKSYNDAIETAKEEKHRADEWHKAAQAWKQAFERSESLREQEQGQAISSASRERDVCNKRVDAAIAANNRIREVVRVETLPNETCPATNVITSDQLRDAIGAR